MKEKRRKTGTGLGLTGVVVLSLLVLQACGGGGSQVGESGGMVERPSGGSSNGGGAAVAAVQESGSGTVTEEGFDRLVVKTAELGVRSGDVRGSAAGARSIAERFGGEVMSSRVYAGSGPVTADLVLSVPSGEFEAALEEMRDLGEKITADTVEGQDVTEEFVDLESRERNLLAAEESLLNLYDRAESVEDTLTVERELTEIRGQIEEVQGRIQYLERRTSTSEIVLHLHPAGTATPQQPWSAAAVASRAWNASLNVLRAGATAVISAAVFSWWLVPAAVVALLWWRWYRAANPADTSG